MTEDPREQYQRQIGEAIDCFGREHDVFLRSKVAHIVEIAGRQLGDLRPLRLLDVGCGVGLMHPSLGEEFGSITGVDMSAEAIESSRRMNPDCEYIAYDGKRLPFEDALFDVATTTNVLHHVPPAEREGLVREIGRVVKPGGLYIIAEHNPLHPATRLVVSRCEFDDDAILLWPRESRRLLAAGRFAAGAVRYILALPSSARWAIQLDRTVGRIPLGTQYIAFGMRTSATN